MEKQGYIFADEYRKLSKMASAAVFIMFPAAIIVSLAFSEYALAALSAGITALLALYRITWNPWMTRYELTEEGVNYLYANGRKRRKLLWSQIDEVKIVQVKIIVGHTWGEEKYIVLRRKQQSERESADRGEMSDLAADPNVVLLPDCTETRFLVIYYWGHF